ncbi:MAG TPA: hypothetical protein VF754_07325, partial [Pyrinomonadaceae bacterium]
MHDCEVTKERLVDLLFDELDDVSRERIRTEVEACPRCSVQYQSMTETLDVFNQAAESALPGEEFWAGYEERLRTRMAQAIPPNAWQQDAASTMGLGRAEYHLTMLEDEGLTRRLLKEVARVRQESELTWPEFKRDPFGFAARSATAYGRAARSFFSQRDVALATASAFV